MSHSIVVTLISIVLLIATGCTFNNGVLVNSEKTSSEIILAPNNSIHYTKKDLKKMYNDIKAKSFVDTPKKSHLIFKDLSPAFGMAHPFSLNLIIDIDGINKHQWPKEAVIGLFAHELSHMVSYEQRGFFGRMLFTWNYPFSVAKRQEVEHEADQIAIDRGYGSELIQERIYQFRIDDKDHLMKQKEVYYWPETLEEIVSKNKQGI